MIRTSFALLLACLLIMASCTPIQAQRGQMVSDEEEGRLIVGTTAKPEVLAALGTPTSVSTFDEKIWYYVGEDTSEVGIHGVKTDARRVLVLRFDESGVLQDKKILGKEDGQSVAMRPNSTKVLSREPTVIQQLIGNVGRFSKGGE